MAIVQIEAYVTWVKYEWHDEPKYTLNPDDMSVCGPEYVPIRKQTFEVEIPDDFDPRPQQINSLRKQQEQILAEATAKATNIEEQIQRLLCLEAPKDSHEALS